MRHLRLVVLAEYAINRKKTIFPLHPMPQNIKTNELCFPVELIKLSNPIIQRALSEDYLYSPFVIISSFF